jgi:hypothetical protein
MATILAGKIISEVGITTLIGTASAITNTSSTICSYLYSIMRYSGPKKSQIITIIFELDIENTIRIVESLLKEIPKEKMDSLPVLQSVDSLHDIIKIISDELKVIYERLNYNEKLLFGSYFRSYDCSKNLKRLKTYNEILDKRRKILFEILQIRGELQNNKSTTNLIFNKIDSNSLKYLERIKNKTIVESMNSDKVLIDDSIKTMNSPIVIKEHF